MADTRRKLKSNQIKIQNLKTAVGVKKLLAYDSDGKIVDGSDLAKVNTFNNGLTELDNNVTLGGEIIQPTELYIREITTANLGFSEITDVKFYDNHYYISGNISGVWRINKYSIHYELIQEYGVFNNKVWEFEITDTGSIIAVGMFTTYMGVSSSRIVKILPNGEIDTAFNVGTGLNAGASGGNTYQTVGITILPDNAILVTGQFTTYNGATRGSIIKINATTGEQITDGGWGGVGIAGSSTIYRMVWDAKPQSTGKIIIAGSFITYNGVATTKRVAARLNADGTLDNTFTLEAVASNYTLDYTQLLIDSDDKIYLCGFNDSLIRCLPDGEIDPTFNGGLPTNANITGSTEPMGQFWKMVLSSEGDLFASGVVWAKNESVFKRIYKFTDGEWDQIFNENLDGFVKNIFLDENHGKAIVFGDFSSYDTHSVGDYVELDINTGDIFLKKGIDVVHEKGLVKYKDNYHDDYDNRTLVDKEYVDNKIAEVPTPVDEFLDLNDVEENSFTGKGNAVVRVTPNSSSLKFYNPSIRINGTTIPVSTPDQSVSVSLAENAEVITITGSGGISLRGVYQSYDNKEITIRNEQDEGNVTILHENLSASADDRFDTGGEDLVLEPNQWIKFLHSKGRWKRQYSDKTNLSEEDFYVSIIEGEEVISSKHKVEDIIEVTDSGSMSVSLSPNYQRSRIIFSANGVVELRGIDNIYEQTGFTVINNTSSPLKIINQYSGVNYKFDVGEDFYVEENLSQTFEIKNNTIILENQRLSETDINYINNLIEQGVIQSNSSYVSVLGNELPILSTDNNFTILGSGTYTQTGFEDIVIPSETIQIVTFNGTKWSPSYNIDFSASVVNAVYDPSTYIDQVVFDNIIGKQQDLGYRNGSIFITLNSLADHKKGATILLTFTINGSNNVFFGDDFDTFYGIHPGESLNNGYYEMYLSYKPNNKVTVNLPSGSGFHHIDSNLPSEFSISSPSNGKIIITWQ